LSVEAPHDHLEFLNPQLSVRDMTDTKNLCPTLEEISNREEISLNGKKLVETGLLVRLPKLRFGIFFEELPIWIAILDHMFVENIIFPGMMSMDHLVQSIGSKPGSALFLNIIQAFDRNLYKFNKQELRSCHLLLISGSLSVLNDITKNKDFSHFFIHHRA